MVLERNEWDVWVLKEVFRDLSDVLERQEVKKNILEGQ